MKNITVITGAGGMGFACAKRLGVGQQLVVCDFSADQLEKSERELSSLGYDVATKQLDVADKASVEAVVEEVAKLGKLKAVIHTAGLSGTMASSERIFDVNLLGTAHIINGFHRILNDQSVGVFIASMAGYSIAQLSKAEEDKFSKLSEDYIIEFAKQFFKLSSGEAYALSKKLNQLQVKHAAKKWGEKGARIMSISPGIISTPMAKKEAAENDIMKQILNNSPVKRIGTPEDIAAVAEFIISSNASFLTGSDILVDGGAASLINALV